MSGGSYNYAYERVLSVADELRTRHSDKTHVLAFADKLDSIAEVMRKIEWADSSDTEWDDRLDEIIKGAVTPAENLASALKFGEMASGWLAEARFRAASDLHRLKA
jgi:hypothetical protein